MIKCDFFGRLLIAATFKPRLPTGVYEIHELTHPEMQGMATEIGRVVHNSRLVRGSRSDPAVHLFY